MPVHTYELNRGGSQIIAISQASVGTEMTVTLNERILGMLTTPAEQSAGRDFPLDDGATLTVQVVDRQVQVRRNGLPLFPARTRAEVFIKVARYDKVAKPIMLICSSLAAIIGVFGFLMIPGLFLLAYFANPYLQTFISPTAATTLVGCAMLLLIACLTGMGHAAARRSWGWVAFGFLPPLLFEIILTAITLTHAGYFWLDLLFIAIIVPIAAVFLFYARRLE